MYKVSKIPTPDEALARYSALCARQECCISDLKLKMRRQHMDELDIDAVIAALVSQGFIDERRYCSSYVSDKLRFAHWGRLRMRREMRRKQLRDEDIEAALEGISPREYREVLRELLTAYDKQLRASSDYQCWTKLMRHAYMHGFESDLAEPIVASLVPESW